MVIILHDAIYSDPQDFLKSDVDETVENQNLQLFFLMSVFTALWTVLSIRL